MRDYSAQERAALRERTVEPEVGWRVVDIVGAPRRADESPSAVTQVRLPDHVESCTALAPHESGDEYQSCLEVRVFDAFYDCNPAVPFSVLMQCVGWYIANVIRQRGR